MVGDAILKLEDKILRKKSEAFDTLYPFATENCASYIQNLQVRKKKLLTVGSSSDQIMEAIYQGCQDITLYDLCPYSQYYFYLKKAGILGLDQKEFVDLFYHKTMDKVAMNKVAAILEKEDQDSFTFFDTLCKKYSVNTMEKALFTKDVLPLSYYQNSHAYFTEPKKFQLVKKKIQYLHPTFIQGDILQADEMLKDRFDIMLLSNISQYLEFMYPSRPLEGFYQAFQGLKENLQENGVIQLAYLYQFAIQDLRKKPILATYDLKGLQKAFQKDSLDIEFIPSINFTQPKKDAVITYTYKK